MSSEAHAVVVVGGGPTGMMLAAELSLAGVDAVMVERRETPMLEGSRAGGLHARTLEVLDQRGVGERFVSPGPARSGHPLSGAAGHQRLPDAPPVRAGAVQNRIEEILAGWVDELEAPVQRGCEVTGVTQDADGVDVALADGRSLRADYVVGCEGGRSVTRKAAGIEFPGWEATHSSLIAEAKIRDDSEVGNIHRDEKGVYGIGQLDDGHVRIIVRDEDLDAAAEPTPAI